MDEFFTKIAGVTYDNDGPNGQNRQTIIRKLLEDGWLEHKEELNLVLETTNPYDSNAIAVIGHNEKQLGYLPRDVAGRIAEQMRNGISYKCYVEAVTHAVDDGAYGVNLRIAYSKNTGSTTNATTTKALNPIRIPFGSTLHGDDFKETMLKARGYHVLFEEEPPAQELVLFKPNGEEIHAKYYSDDLVIIKNHRLLKESVDTFLNYENPLYAKNSISGIDICAVNVPEHGDGQLIRAFLKNGNAMIVVRFPNSKCLIGKKEATFSAEAIRTANLVSTTIKTSELYDLVVKEASAPHEFEKDIDLDGLLEQYERERNIVLSQRMHRIPRINKCLSCGQITYSSDANVCAHCHENLLCNYCGYCPSCFVKEENDPYSAIQRAEALHDSAFWWKKHDGADYDFDPSDVDCFDMSDEPDIHDLYSKSDLQDMGPDEEPYEYYHSDDDFSETE